MRKIQILLSPFINYIKLKRNNIRFGKNIRMVGPVRFKTYGSGYINIGDDFLLMSGLMMNAIARNTSSFLRADPNATIQIGNNVGMSSVTVWSKKLIRIGNNVKIGADSIILDSDVHSLNYEDRRHTETDVMNCTKKEIIIEDDVFIGARAIITKGVHIGKNSIVAAGSVVSKNIPPNEIWGGESC